MFRKSLDYLLAKYRRKRITLRTKLMVIISTLVLISLTALTIGNLNLFENEMTDMAKLLNARTGKLLADKVSSELEKRKALAETINTLGNSVGFYSTSVKKTLTSLLASKDSDLLYFAIVNKYSNKKSIAWENEISYTNNAILTKESILIADLKLATNSLKKSSKAIFNNQYLLFNLSKQIHHPVWAMTTVLNTKENVAIAVYSSNVLSSIFAGRKLKENEKVKDIVTSVLLNDQGDVIFHPDLKKIMLAVNLSVHPLVKKMFQSQTKNGWVKFSKNGHPFYGSFNKLKVINSGVITYVSEEKALEGVNVARINSLLIAAFLIVLAILFIYFFAKTLSEPLKELALAADNIYEGDFDSRIALKHNDEIGDVSIAFNLMAEGLKEREKLKGAFGKFVDPKIVGQILKGDIKLGGEEKETSVFFSDIRSFTAISDPWEPNKIVEFLNSYMTLMVKEIQRQSGIVDKFIGDAIMAVWGLPNADVNDALHSVEAALSMREILLQYNLKRGSIDKPYIHIGCGIATGKVLAGQIGSEDRLEYTVIGDTVNLASRIEHLCKRVGVDILISESTYRKVKKSYRVIQIKDVHMRGISDRQQIYIVLGRRNDKNCPSNLKELRNLLEINTEIINGKLKVRYALVKK